MSHRRCSFGALSLSIQNLFNLVIIGIGIIVGSKIATRIAEWSTVGDKLDFSTLFAWPMWGSVACLVILLAVYPNRRPAAA